MPYASNFHACHCMQQLNFFLYYEMHYLFYRVYSIEKQINAPEKFRFPHYESVSWYAASKLVTELRDMAADGTRVPPIMIAGARALAAALRQWGGEVRLIVIFLLHFLQLAFYNHLLEQNIFSLIFFTTSFL